MLYSKRWLEDELSLEGAMLFTSSALNQYKDVYENYQTMYCLEADIINKINANEEGYFDFSKAMIDVGAGICEYACITNFSYSYSFEPCKETYWNGIANLLNFEKTNTAEIYKVFLSDCKEVVKFNGFNTIDDNDNMKVVETTYLDTYNFKNIGFIKIDVEGFEEKVIRGGLLTIISNNYPPILFECWDVGVFGMTQEKRDSLFNLLKTLGYEIFEYWGDWETHLAVHKTQLEKNNQ